MTVKKVKKRCSQQCPDAVGEEIDPVASAAGDEVFLHQFGQSAVGDADDDGEEDGLASICYPVGNELFAVAPKAKEGESGIHAEMRHLVEAHNGLDAWKNRTRKPCQNQDDDSAQDSRVAISGQPFQELSQS